ncbi:MAG: c-type cytochrome [Candidatus Acidiferrales bacterium]
MRGFLFGIVFTVLVAVVGGFFYLKQGYMNLQADQKPSTIERKLAASAVDASTERHAPETKNPTAPAEQNLTEGARLYLNHCAGCHGIPSNRETQFGKSFNPPVPQFFSDAPDMPENENFYITQHGIRFSGMPAWGGTLSENQIWLLVTFMSNIEKLPPVALKELEPTGAAANPPLGR